MGTIHNAVADYRPDEPRLVKRCQVMADKYFHRSCTEFCGGWKVQDARPAANRGRADAGPAGPPARSAGKDGGHDRPQQGDEA